MNDFVALSKHKCPACGKIHSRKPVILIHKNLQKIPDEDAMGPLQLCEEHFKEGYVSLIEVENYSEESVTVLGRMVYVKTHIIEERLKKSENFNSDQIKNVLEESFLFTNSESIDGFEKLHKEIKENE